MSHIKGLKILMSAVLAALITGLIIYALVVKAAQIVFVQRVPVKYTVIRVYATNTGTQVSSYEVDGVICTLEGVNKVK